MSNAGHALLDFGATPTSDASLVVSGQTGILTTSFLEVWIEYAATADHTADEHLVEPLRVVAGSIVSWVDETGERDVGYWLGREFWGRGIATAALQLFLLEVRTRPLYGRAAKDNAGSIRVLEKCGFRSVPHENPHPEDGVEEVLLALDQ